MYYMPDIQYSGFEFSETIILIATLTLLTEHPYDHGTIAPPWQSGTYRIQERVYLCLFFRFRFFFLFYFESQFIERATVWLIQWQSYERFLVKKVMPLNQSSVDIYPPGTHDNRAIHMEFVGGFCSWEQKFEGGEVSAKERIIGHNMRDRS